jgi:alkanesulfonate monooxygenase SsuD/methylene tetrahydromethanopterin reductase-like flavin-dependent oxidoreductase (luciferase family)
MHETPPKDGRFRGRGKESAAGPKWILPLGNSIFLSLIKANNLSLAKTGGDHVMKFGLFDHVDINDRPLAQLLDERIKFVVAAEKAGFYCYHIAEHHATPLNMVPVPGVYLGAVAQATSSIRLGPLGYLLPLYSPLRLIEEICILDHLSNGRLDVGVGRGISPFELKFHDVDPATSRPIFAEALETVLYGLSNDVLNHEGENFKYRDVPMELKPLQKPHPPIWYPTNSIEGGAFGGENGYNYVTLGGIDFAKPSIDAFKEAFTKRGRPGDGATADFEGGAAIGIMRHLVIAETEDEAMRIAEPAYQAWEASLTKLWRVNKVPGPNIAEFIPPTLEEAMKRGSVVVGTPAKVQDKLAEDIQAGGLNYMVTAFYFGNIGHQHALNSMETFAAEIMPTLSDL